MLKRERVGSTALGRGIAIPHAKTPAVAGPVVAFARLAEPIRYGATDAEDVHSVFLVVSPPDAADEHIAMLSMRYDDKPWKRRENQRRIIFKIKPVHFDEHD